jgi:hypothetical protein
MHARYADRIDDPQLISMLQFMYPDSGKVGADP